MVSRQFSSLHVSSGTKPNTHLGAEVFDVINMIPHHYQLNNLSNRALGVFENFRDRGR